MEEQWAVPMAGFGHRRRWLRRNLDEFTAAFQRHDRKIQ